MVRADGTGIFRGWTDDGPDGADLRIRGWDRRVDIVQWGNYSHVDNKRCVRWDAQPADDDQSKWSRRTGDQCYERVAGRGQVHDHGVREADAGRECDERELHDQTDGYGRHALRHRGQFPGCSECEWVGADRRKLHGEPDGNRADAIRAVDRSIECAVILSRPSCDYADGSAAGRNTGGELELQRWRAGWMEPVWFADSDECDF